MESVKATAALYTAEELVTSRAGKNNIQGAIEEFINTTLDQKGVAGADPRERGYNLDFDLSLL